MKSASGKRPPDEAHGPGKEAIRPQTVFAFLQFYFQKFTYFSIVVQNSRILMIVLREFSKSYDKDQNNNENILDSPIS